MSGHPFPLSSCSFAGFFVARDGVIPMSVMLRIPDSCRTSRHFAFGPGSDICTATNRTLFDHLVGRGDSELRGGGVVLKNLSEQVRECLRHAMIVREKLPLKLIHTNFLDLEQR